MAGDGEGDFGGGGRKRGMVERTGEVKREWKLNEVMNGYES